MNYELKSVAPVSVFFNGLRVFLIVGFLVAILSFFVIPNPSMNIVGFGRKLAATALFTGVYGLVVSLVLMLIAFLYNFWAGKFRGVRFHIEQSAD